MAWLRLAQQCSSGGGSSIPKVYLTTLLSKVFSFSNFLGGRDGDGDGTDGHMDRQTFLGKYYFRLYFSGHVLGAAMFQVRVGSESLVYTGDYNMTPDRHLGAAWIGKDIF